MRIIRGLESCPPDARSSVVALGAFDGVHLAHQKILGLSVDRAREIDAFALACTFDPHPLEVLKPDQAPTPITTLDERLELIAGCGIDATVVIPFTPELSRIEAETFVKEVLLDTLRAREIVVGFNHTFGRGARGDARLLEALGERLGFVAHVVAPLMVDGITVSSSAIRDALRGGDMQGARRLLGRPYTIRGSVVRGAGRGRQLGFPTANIKPDRPLVLATGVYGGYARLDDGRRAQSEAGSKCVVNIGYRPTFGENEYWIEAYLLDFSEDIYDRTLTISFVARIREERKFPDLEALRTQIRADIDRAARLL